MPKPPQQIAVHIVHCESQADDCHDICVSTVYDCLECKYLTGWLITIFLIFILPTPQTLFILLLVAILSSPGTRNLMVKDKCQTQPSKMTILDCVFSGKFYENKILHELWAIM